MTDNEIIKALECCGNQMYYCGNKDCKAKVLGGAVDLINRQQAEIERLQKVNDSFTDIGKLYSEIKAEAIKEFAERLKEKQQTFTGDEYIYKFIYLIEIDNLVKEMVGDE